MPQVFVHGVPETDAIWRGLFDELRARGARDLVALSPPGFGAPVPAGFEPSRTGYRDWLVGELERLGGGVDLVGHDWGAGHTLGVLAERPDLLRSWAIDCAGLVHPDYVWHDLAQAWQTPGAGEQTLAAMFGLPPEQRVATVVSFGLRPDAAEAVAAAWNDEMARCILALYRSARQPAMAELGARLRTTPRRPGLVLIPSEDPYAGPPARAEAVAAGLGACTVTLAGQGHWWMFAAAKEVADALVAHWEAA